MSTKDWVQQTRHFRLAYVRDRLIQCGGRVTWQRPGGLRTPITVRCALLVWDSHFNFKVSQFPFNSNVLLHTKRHYSSPYSFQQACFADFAVCLHAAASFLSPKAVFFACTTGSWTAENSAQNALDVDILKSKIKNFFSGDGVLPLHQWRGDTPSPHPTSVGVFGASVLAPMALDLLIQTIAPLPSLP